MYNEVLIGEEGNTPDLVVEGEIGCVTGKDYDKAPWTFDTPFPPPIE